MTESKAKKEKARLCFLPSLAGFSAAVMEDAVDGLLVFAGFSPVNLGRVCRTEKEAFFSLKLALRDGEMGRWITDEAQLLGPEVGRELVLLYWLRRK